MASHTRVSTGKRAGSDDSHSVNRGGSTKDEEDKILMAGPSVWESTQTNLVHELRVLVRARDMALAEQRARHVKESVVIREQRHAIETTGLAFSKNIAKLFGWGDSAREQNRISPNSVSPVSVSPVFSPSASPIGSPTSLHRKSDDNLMDDAASRAQCGSGTTATTNAADASVAGACHAESQQQTPLASLGVVDELDFRVLGGETGNRNDEESRKQSSPSGIVGTDAPSAPVGSSEKVTAANTCPRCMRLTHERDLAITERSLAEAELVSIRRQVSQIDPSWECTAEFKTRNSIGPDVTVIEDDKADKTAPVSPCGDPDSSNVDLGLREEVSRLEKLVALSEDDPPPRDLVVKCLDTGFPIIQEFALMSEQDGARNSSKMPDLAGPLSAAVTSRARHFEELSRRRLLRLGVEGDLRAARVKLNSLRASAMTASLVLDHPKGDDYGETRDETRELCGEEGAPPPPGESGVGNTTEAKGTSDNKNSNTDRDEGASSPHFVSSTRGRGSRAKRGARPGRGQNASAQRPGRGGGKDREIVSVPIDAGTTPSCEALRSRGSKETSVTRKAPKVTAEESPRLPRGDTEVVTGTSEAHNRNKKGAKGGEVKKRGHVLAQSATDGSAVEGDDVDLVAADDNFKDVAGAKKCRSCVDQAVHENGDDCGQPLPCDVIDIDHAAHDNEDDCGQSHLFEVIDVPCENRKKCASGEEPPSRYACPTLPSASKEACMEAGGEQQPLCLDDARTNDETLETCVVTKKDALIGAVAHARSPRALPHRHKGAPRTAAQLQRVPRSQRGTSSVKGAVAHSVAAIEAAAEEEIHETPADGSDGSMAANARHENAETRATVLEREVFLEDERTTGETVVDDTMEHVPHSGVHKATEYKQGKHSIPKKGVLPKGPTNQNRARVAQRSLHGTGGRGKLANTRSMEKTANIKAVPRAGRGTQTRLGTTMKERRSKQDGAFRIPPAEASPELEVEAKKSKKAQETKAAEENGVLLVEDGGQSASRVQVPGKETKKDDAAEEKGRGSMINEGGEKVAAATGPIQPGCPLEAHHMLTVASGEDPIVVDRGKKPGKGDGETGNCRGGSIVMPERSIPGRTDGSGDLPLLRGLEDLAEALRIEVDRLRLEKAELEDTVAQLNVAAAQLYIVEYQQMKAKCRQLKRVVLGPASRPTEVESAYGNSCQEIMHRLKMIGVNFFRRRIGGAMGDRFFPDGLSRVLSLIGQEQVAQGCQTAPCERRGSIEKDRALPALPGSRDIHVQVTGGIDVEDEPLMEQQVYALLGRLDLLLKRREDILSTYHREAAEGAQEARALLALAAAQHHPGQAWGMCRPPNVRPLIGGREGPAGAPRPAINPTNLLFSAAVVLDSVSAAGAANQSPESVRTSKSTRGQNCSAGSNGESRRRRFSIAEKALLELADEVVAALEAEQRRSDASAERRRFVADRHNSSSGGDNKALGRPSIGVPPLIWAMEIHLVGKLARAFRTAVEARGFEREVEDANLVAAVTLGRSSSPSGKGNGKSDDGSPWHLGHRMLSVLRGEGEGEEGARRQTPQGNLEDGLKEEMAHRIRENPQFDWGSDTYSPRKAQHRSVSCNGGTDGRQKYRPSTAPSPRKAEGLARGELSRRQAIKGRAGIRDSHHALTPNHSRSPVRGEASEVRALRQKNGGRTVQEARGNGQDQQRRDSSAIARVEAAVFDTVRPSCLHPRPGSASVGGRSDRAGNAGCSTSAVTDRLRPQSARLAEPRSTFPAGVGRAATDEHKTAYRSSPPDVQRDARRPYEGESTSESCVMADRRQQPLRPALTATAGRRPASAGDRVVDTRIWSSNNKVVEARAGVFRCRPNKSVYGASVQFDSAAAGGDVPGLPWSPHVPTHSGEVPEFLRRKELELLKADQEKRSATNGRFEIVPDDDDHVSRSGCESNVDGVRVEHRPHGIWRHRSNGRRRLTRAPESQDGREGGVGATLVEQNDVGSGSDDGNGDRTLSSLRLEDSMDGEGLLPDAGEQAFFDAWKPTGYGIDLSRYD